MRSPNEETVQILLDAKDRWMARALEAEKEVEICRSQIKSAQTAWKFENDAFDRLNIRYKAAQHLAYEQGREMERLRTASPAATPPAQKHPNTDDESYDGRDD